MIKEIKSYKCEVCDCTYETREVAIECLESHNLVYNIQKYVSDHDYWGRSEGSYEDSEITFKHFEDAENYIKRNPNARIKTIKLL